MPPPPSPPNSSLVADVPGFRSNYIQLSALGDVVFVILKDWYYSSAVNPA